MGGLHYAYLFTMFGSSKKSALIKVVIFGILAYTCNACFSAGHGQSLFMYIDNRLGRKLPALHTFSTVQRV